MMLDETWDRRLGRQQGLFMQYVYGQSVGNSVATGVDLSKILGGNKILGVKVVIKSWAFLIYWGGGHPGCSPKSTPRAFFVNNISGYAKFFPVFFFKYNPKNL